MEAAPRLPMISFELKVSTENVSFSPKLKQYIASFYHEDPESYNNEIHSLESLRSTAVRPAIDVTGCQNLKQYYCQLKFLKSRFPMEKGQPSAVSFSWKDLYSGVSYTLPDINFELSCILHNIGALHSQLGAADTRSSSEGMKMSCTHFQCAAWAFQHLKENYTQMITVALLPEVIHFMQQLCLAQAQECILEKSMLDNRKSTIIAKVAVQVVDYYNSAMQILTAGNEFSTLADIVGNRVLKDWNRYLKFKIAYHSCISFLYQGQQAEEAQKMGERVAYYQAASEQLEEARKIAKGNMGQQQHEVDEALAFTQDVVEGKKKAAKNENEFIYHEVVPEKDALQQVNGASLVKGTPFSVNDPEVSGKDLFSRLVPMEAHEASSLYSEQKAEMLRQIGAIVETKDSDLVEFMSSLQLDCLNQWRQAIGVPQDIVDRAAAICAKPEATQALIEIMGKLAGTCHEVESLLSDIQELIKEEEKKEQEYQKIMGTRPPSIVATDLSREAGKYSEAHSKANESNQTLHRAMTMHMSNLKILAQPLSELKKAIPGAVSSDPSIDDGVINELENLIAKVDEMRTQRATLVSQLRESVFADDITALLVTKPPDISMEQLFQKELTKHKRQASLIEQNLAAQDNILSALTEVYAKFAGTRRYMLDVLKRREATTSALIASYDAYDDLLAKANKGIEFYQKLEGNVAKLLQRVKSACRVNDEEREQMLAKSNANTTSSTPKLKDYLAGMKTGSIDTPQWVPSVRPTPLGQEETKDTRLPYDAQITNPPYQSNTSYYPSGTAPQIQSYTDPNVYYNPSVENPTPQSYPSTYYQTPEKNLQNYPSYVDPPLPASQQQIYPANYYTDLSGATYFPTYAKYPNYQMPAVYKQDSSSYTPASTPQINYSIPGIYSPSTDTSAPSQKLPLPTAADAIHQNVEKPPSNYTYPATENYQNVEKNHSYATANTENYATYQQNSNQYYVPNNEYQKQNDYIPQYYPNSGYYQSSETNESVVSTGYHQTDPSNYYTTPYGYQTIGMNPLTMMQANNNSASTSTTSGSSNVDLLTGLDFSVSQAPLQPVNVKVATTNEPKMENKKEPVEKEKPIVEQEVHVEKPTVEQMIPPQDPLSDPETLNLFSQEVDKLEKFVDGLTTKTLNGPTPLDIKWKEIQEQQDRDVQKSSISVARCYPMKNRFPDILPYDHSRVELPSTKDDYINASYVRDISLNAPPLIVTQAPLKSTLDDFWTMVWEQQIELVVCLLADAELQQEDAVMYWPSERGSDLQIGKFKLVLQGVNIREHFTERIISISDGNKQLIVVHIQFVGWPGSGLFPNTVFPLISLANSVVACHRQQRIKNRPILIQCLSGVGRSGVLCVLIAAICDPLQTLDVAAVASRMSQSRKNILRDREHLKFAYQAVLQHAKDLLSGKQLQTKLQNVNIAGDESSNASSSAEPSTDQTKQRKKFTRESFEALKEQGITPVSDTSDPLSSLDPLWTIRK